MKALPMVRVRYLGRQPYAPVWRAMQRFTDLRDAHTLDEIWLLEHDPIFTLGQAGKPEHVLAAGDIPVLPVDRGGQVTYHGPGQIVLYPLIDLRRLGFGVKELVSRIEQAIIDAKKDKPHWGARKIRELLMRRLAGDVRIPARSTIHAVLDRYGLVKRAGKRRQRALGTSLSSGSVPNALWCVDFKGEFRLGNQAYCYPLTVTDHASRFILACEALEGTREAPVIGKRPTKTPLT